MRFIEKVRKLFEDADNIIPNEDTIPVVNSIYNNFASHIKSIANNKDINVIKKPEENVNKYNDSRRISIVFTKKKRKKEHFISADTYINAQFSGAGLNIDNVKEIDILPNGRDGESSSTYVEIEKNKNRAINAIDRYLKGLLNPKAKEKVRKISKTFIDKVKQEISYGSLHGVPQDMGGDIIVDYIVLDSDNGETLSFAVNGRSEIETDSGHEYQKWTGIVNVDAHTGDLLDFQEG